MRSCQGKLLWILLAAIIILLVVAAVSGGIYLLLRQRQNVAGSWQDPVAAILPEEIEPDVALYPLAGAVQSQTIDAALANGDLETAYVLLVFGLDLSDAQRIGRFLRLGSQFVGADRPERASLVYQQVYDTAVISPDLSDPERADALLASAQGWASAEQIGPALEAYEQVYVLALGSPYLQMAQRRELLAVFETAYQGLGEEGLADSIRTQIVHLDQQARQPTALPSQSPDLPGKTEPVSSPEVGALEESRRQAAFAVLKVVEQGVEPLPELVETLAQALRAEDAAKQALYSQELERTSQPGRRINVHWHRIEWLTLKSQVAAKGFGLSLVPEWEVEVTQIQSALSTAYEDLRFEYEDLVAGLPEASLIGPGNYQVRRQVILSGRLGHYPNYPEVQLADRLRDAVNELIAAGFIDRLYVDWAPEDGGLRFFLSPAGEYGLADQSP